MGGFMRKGQHAIAAALLFLALSAVIAGPGGAQGAGPSAETQACLSCHTKHGLVVTFENNEFVEAYVDAEKFNISAHHSLSCTSCHTDFSAGNHPRRTFRSKAHYQTKAALVCRR